MSLPEGPGELPGDLWDPFRKDHIYKSKLRNGSLETFVPPKDRVDILFPILPMPIKPLDAVGNTHGWGHRGGEKSQPARSQDPLKVCQVLGVSFCFMDLGTEAVRSLG